MNEPSPFILAFTNSLQGENWKTSFLSSHRGKGIESWKASLKGASFFTCKGTDETTAGQALEAVVQSGATAIFGVGKTWEEMAFFLRLKGLLPQSLTFLIIALRSPSVQENEQLEKNGADFVVSNLSEVTALITTSPLRSSLSVLLLAYNEEAVLEKAVNDIHVFCRRYAPEYEIIIVNDGSTDRTAALANTLQSAQVRVITHVQNRGMGASMKDGYDAAHGAYVVSLPGDRQVKAHSLAAFLPHIHEDTVVLSRYPVPHSGIGRAVMSTVFRQFTRHVGKLSVDVAGAYLFSTSLYHRCRVPDTVASDTFLYSFQLLEMFKRQGARFMVVDVVPFPREMGASREATVGRVAKMMREIVKHRLLSKWQSLLH